MKDYQMTGGFGGGRDEGGLGRNLALILEMRAHIRNARSRWNGGLPPTT